MSALETLVLEVADWAAIVYAGEAARSGGALNGEAVPARQRRRLSSFARDVVCCALPLLRRGPPADVVFSSANGDLESAVALLFDTARREILSPTLFSLSVHNAPAGVLSLCVEDRCDHTAIAAGAASLQAGLTECYLRLQETQEGGVVLVFGEERLPPIYAHLNDDAPGAFLAMRLGIAAAGRNEGASLGLGRAGAVALVKELQAGRRQVSFAPPSALAFAA